MRAGNLMVSRVAALVRYLEAKGVAWVSDPKCASPHPLSGIVSRKVHPAPLACHLVAKWSGCSSVAQVIEQPASSLMMRHPRMAALFQDIKIYQVHVYMGAYGAETPKPSFLWSSSPWVACLAMRKLDRKSCTGHTLQVTKRYVDATGRARIAGGADLKGTQACRGECLKGLRMNPCFLQARWTRAHVDPGLGLTSVAQGRRFVLDLA